MPDTRFAEMVLDAALSTGADAAEVYTCSSRETEITVGDGKAEMSNVKHDSGIGIRVLKNNRMAFASSSAVNEAAAIEMVRTLCARSSLHSPDEYNVIPEPRPQKIENVIEPFDASLETIPLGYRIDKILDVERSARSFDPRVRGFLWLQYNDSIQEILVINSLGVKTESRGSMVSVFAYAVASDDRCTQTGLHTESSGFFDKLSASDVGIRTARKAVRMLGARPGNTCLSDIVLPPETSSAFLNAIAAMLSADNVQKGKSPFTGLMGTKVASDIVTVLDDGLLPHGLATGPYDAEGMPTESTTLIDHGELKSFISDSYCAKKSGTESTGNASRASYHSQPAIAPTNFYLRPGRDEKEKLLSSIGDGLYIAEVSGLHAAINPVTADFSVPAKAIAIRSGKLEEPIDRITLSGNLLNFLKRIDFVADDLEWFPATGMIGAPTIVARDVKITGE